MVRKHLIYKFMRVQKKCDYNSSCEKAFLALFIIILFMIVDVDGYVKETFYFTSVLMFTFVHNLFKRTSLC